MSYPGITFLFISKKTILVSMSLGSFIVDAGCLASVVGIWPRFIEPKLLSITHLSCGKRSSTPLKIAHLTDLHFHAGMSERFLHKITRAITTARPDLIVFTGDFLCYARLEEEERLLQFLQGLRAPLGCFCTLGNHDYSLYVSRNAEGIYDVLPPPDPLKGVSRALRVLFEKKLPKGMVSQAAASATLHEGLLSLLRKTSFRLLCNETVLLPCGLNVVGLGEYSLGRCRPQEAFAHYDHSCPGLVLTHNPDSFPLLLEMPGDVLLAGHTHGEQIHFPFPGLRTLSKKLTRLENPAYTRGLFHVGNKMCYVNRGVGGHKPFRLFSPPELLLLTLSL